MQIKIRKSEVYFIFAWVLAAVAGRALFMMLEVPLTEYTFLIAPVSGLIRAASQWVVLSTYLRRADLWAIITFAGVTLNALIVSALDSQIQNLYIQINPSSMTNVFIFFAAIQGVQGLFVGGFQWLALRAEVRKAWQWILGLGFAFAASTVFNLFYLTQLMAKYGQQNITATQHNVRSLLTTLLSAVLTGLLINWLLNDRLEDEDLEDIEDADVDDDSGYEDEEEIVEAE